MQPLPAEPFDTLRKLEQRVRHDGLISISGNHYSVPDPTQQVVAVHKLPQTICIVDGGWLVASHSILEGRRQYRVDPEQQ